MLGITLRWTSIPSREARETGISSGLMGQFGQTSLWLLAGHISFVNTPILYCNLVGRKYFFIQMAREFAPFIRAKRQFHWLSITKLVHHMFFHFLEISFCYSELSPWNSQRQRHQHMRRLQHWILHRRGRKNGMPTVSKELQHRYHWSHEQN